MYEPILNREERRKLSSPWSKSYTVEAQTFPIRYRLRNVLDPDMETAVHVNRLKEWRADDGDLKERSITSLIQCRKDGDCAQLSSARTLRWWDAEMQRVLRIEENARPEL